MGIFSNKLSAKEKEDFSYLKMNFKPEFIQNEVSGFTICKVVHPGGNFMRVAISYCNPLDKFNKKRGKYEALRKIIEDGQFMLMPRFIGPEYEAILQVI